MSNCSVPNMGICIERTEQVEAFDFVLRRSHVRAVPLPKDLIQKREGLADIFNARECSRWHLIAARNVDTKGVNHRTGRLTEHSGDEAFAALGGSTAEL